MERIKEKNNNSPEEYDRIYSARAITGPNWQDLRRWKRMLKYYRGGDLLDIGCLDSLVTIMASKMKNKGGIVGTDVAQEALKSMNAMYKHIHYLEDDIMESDMPENHFDYVCLGEVLEHLEDPLNAIKNAVKLTKPGGWIVISVPHNEAVELGAVDGDRHMWSFHAKGLTKIMNKYGHSHYKILGSKYFPKYKYCFPQLIIYCEKK